MIVRTDETTIKVSLQAKKVAVSIFKGKQGNTGPAGATGSTGAKGDKGDTGNTGPAGASDFITPEAYGAVGDGTTDDSTAINLAIQAAYTLRKRLLCAAVTYRCFSPLLVNAPIHLEGRQEKSQNGTVFMFSNGIDGLQLRSTGGPVSGGADRARLSDFKIITNSSVATWGASQSAVAGSTFYKPTTGYAGFVYKCTTSGGSGTVEPTWPLVEGNTVASNGGAVFTAHHVAGISLKSQFANFERVIVSAFDGDGMSGDSTDGSACNLTSFRDCGFDSNLGDGAVPKGPDSNVLLFDHCSFVSNGLVGAHDLSALGCVWIANHFDSNVGLAFDMYDAVLTLGSSAHCEGNYLEGGQTGRLAANGMWFGGTDAHNIDTTLGGVLDSAESGRNTLQTIQTYAGITRTLRLMRNQTDVLQEFFTSDDGGRAYQQIYKQVNGTGSKTGWWSWLYGGTTSPIAFSNALAAEGGGKLWLPGGFLAGATDYYVSISWGDAAPVSGTHKAGEVVYLRAGAGGVYGWYCSVAGTPGTWVTMYRPVLMVGDAGSGGFQGLVPAPASGDAAASKYLKADGTWAVPSSGTNTGDVTLAAVGSTPSANGASLSGQVLTLQPADATHPGVLPALDKAWINRIESTIDYSAGAGEIQTQKPVSVGGYLSATGVLSASNFSGSSSGANTGDQTNISGNAATVTTNANLTGPVTSVGNATAITDDAVTNAKLANVATATIKGRTTSGTGDPEDLTATQATALLNTLVGDAGSGGTNGLAPAPSSGDAAAKKYLKADGTWAAIAESDVTNLTTDLAAKVASTRTINTTAPVTGGGDLSADRTIAVSTMTGDSGSGGARGVVPAPAAGDAAAGKFLKADGTWATAAASLTVSDKTADYPIVAADTGKVFTNKGAAGAINFTLPTAAANLEFSFAVQAAQYLRVTSNTGDMIRIAEVDSATAGYIRSNETGGFLSLVCLDDTVWIARFIPTRTWLIDQ